MSLAVPLITATLLAQAPATSAPPKATALRSPAEVRGAFTRLLDRPRVPLDVRKEPARESENDSRFLTERLSIASERKRDGSIERVPILIVRRPDVGTPKRRPAVIVLHGTGGTKDRMRPWLDDLARRGFVAVAIDARHHGDRAGGAQGSTAYVAAITRTWRTPAGQPMEHPFYYDTCWDLWRTFDYLETRPDVDPKRVAMLGTSMGGIQTWLAAAVDERVAAAVPAIGVQSFRWSLENGAWQARANTIKEAHEAAARDLGHEKVDAEVCRALWSKIIPGILDEFDCPSMLRLLAGRPLLILNGEKDPNCPLAGAKIAFAAAERAYADAGAADKLRILVAEGAGHTVTPSQHAAALDWLVTWLKP